jgi:hypothetical protein
MSGPALLILNVAKHFSAALCVPLRSEAIKRRDRREVRRGPQRNELDFETVEEGTNCSNENESF